MIKLSVLFYLIFSDVTLLKLSLEDLELASDLNTLNKPLKIENYVHTDEHEGKQHLSHTNI